MSDYCFEIQSYRQLHKFENGQCIYCREMAYKISFTKPQNVSKEWAKLFLEQWNRAVKLWNDGGLFLAMTQEEKQAYSIMYQSNYTAQQRVDQKIYAQICTTWLIPNGFVEPHCVAEGE